MVYQVPWAKPGMGTELENYTGELVWGGNEREVLYQSSMIDGASRFGTSPILRPGLLMGTVAATGKLKQWDPEATDGTQKISAVLENDLKMVDLSAANTDVFFRTLRKAPLIAAALFIGDEAMVGANNEWLARRQLAELGCLFDDKKSGVLEDGQVILNANTTLDATHYNRTIVVTGARTITVPAASAANRGVEFLVHATGGTTTFATGATGTLAAGQSIHLRCIVTGAGTQAWALSRPLA
jgi:hypothetical protein